MIVLAPWAKKTTTGERSPKDYPFWEEVVRAFPNRVTQVSMAGEPSVPGAQVFYDRSLKQITALLRDCATFVSVDSFLPHLAWASGVRGVVVWGPSDPVIFGHDLHVNVLKSRSVLRARQFGLWAEEKWRPEIFPPAPDVVEAIRQVLRERGA